ncbi:MAG: hypothetical protein PWQ35_614 [Patescibacteria group bacterium]|nr:hypothetical protein [Patescibacteria group bacterium]
MNKDQLDSLQKELKISIDKIIREETEILFLTELTDYNLGNTEFKNLMQQISQKYNWTLSDIEK